MDFAKIYQLLVNKATKKGRTKAEVDEVIHWLTGYSQEELDGLCVEAVSYGDFFRKAPQMNEKRNQIKGVICASGWRKLRNLLCGTYGVWINLWTSLQRENLWKRYWADICNRSLVSRHCTIPNMSKSSYKPVKKQDCPSGPKKGKIKANI